MANLTALMEKYDPLDVEDDLDNLAYEVADEVEVAATLAQDSAVKTAAVLKFISDNKEAIADQHSRMKAGVESLAEKVSSNMDLEAADAAYQAAISSEEAVNLAQMLLELNAMSDSYHDLLKKNGRVGRVPK